MRNVILYLLAAAATPAMALTVAQERFLVGADGVGYIADVNMAKMVEAPVGTSQYLPPEESGMIGFYGTFNAGDVDINSDVRWEPGNTFLPFQVTAGSLNYGNLSALGGKLSMASGGVGYFIRMDTALDGVFGDYVVNVPSGTNNPAGGNLIGKDGTTLYLSFLFKLNLLNVGSNQNILSFQDTVNLNRTLNNSTQVFDRTPQGRWTFGQTWANQDFRVEGGSIYKEIDLNTHLVVVKVVYQAGNDNVFVWFDPDLTKTEAEQVVIPIARNMQFSAIRMVAQQSGSVANGFSIDELRFGETWSDVVVLAAEYDFVVTEPEEGGSVTQNPAGTTFIEGTEVQLTALAEDGYRFVTWTGDVAAADLTNPIITVTVDGDKAIGVEFEEIPEVTVTVDVSPAETAGTVEAFPSFTVAEGEEIEITAVPAEGYEFVSWTRGDETITENPLIISPEADETITANFAEVVIPCTVTDTVFTETYWYDLGGNFIYGMNYESYLYTAFCPFVYDFATTNWLYVYDGGATEAGFFAFDYADGEWYYFLSGYKLSLAAE